MDNRAMIQTSLDYIEENLQAEITAAELAEMAHISLFHYYRLFQQAMGMPVMQYILRRRLLHGVYAMKQGKSYMHHGKDFCPSHRIREAELDAQVQQYAEAVRNQWITEQADLQRLYRKWSLKQPALDKTIAQLREEIRRHEEEIDELLMLRIQSTK